MSRRVRVKPGKGQSMAGFFFGLIFCFIGLFVVIPMTGAFGFLWTLFAVIGTVTSGINAFSDKGIASHEITIDEDISQNSGSGSSSKSTEERLKELQNLYEKDMISYEEYQAKRKQILEDI